MATNIINYAPDATPPSPTSAPSITVQPVVSRPAPGPSTGRGLWEGRLRPAEIQIIVIGTQLHASSAVAKPDLLDPAKMPS